MESASTDSIFGCLPLDDFPSGEFDCSTPIFPASVMMSSPLPTELTLNGSAQGGLVVDSDSTNLFIGCLSTVSPSLKGLSRKSAQTMMDGWSPAGSLLRSLESSTLTG